MSEIRPLEAKTLLPPLLECLKEANHQLPPALLRLVTPIMQQRVNLLSSASGSWLLLLNWNRDLAKKLPGTLQNANLDHAYRGSDRVFYRRLDPETVLARIEAKDYQLLATYLWCVADEKNLAHGTWKLHELRCLEDEDEMSKWSDSLQEAEAVYKSSNVPSTKINGNSKTVMPYETGSNNQTDDEDDDSYWASYDMTPGQSRGRTPAKISPAASFLHGGVPNRVPSRTATNEADYFDRYEDVQPALDPYDPQEDMAGVDAKPRANHGRRMVTLEAGSSANHQNNNTNGTSYDEEGDNDDMEVDDENDGNHLTIRQPRPHSSSTSSSHSQASPKSIAKLEEVAEGQAQAEIGIKQHISTDIKSLYRLAKSAGISREEFVRIIKRELEVLPLLDME